MVGVLKGSVIFMADLLRAITIPVSIDFMSVSSYGSGVKTSGVVKIIKDLDHDLSGYDVLIVEDILDSGLTLSYLTNVIRQRNVKSIRVATLLDKPDRRQVNIKPDYSCSRRAGQVCGRLRHGLQPEIPQPALRRRAEAGSLYKKRKIIYRS